MTFSGLPEKKSGNKPGIVSALIIMMLTAVFVSAASLPVSAMTLTDDGTVLLSTQTSSFPIAEQNITGIKSESGTILFQYINQGESSVVTNEDGTTTTVEGESESKEIKRSVTFVAE